MLQLSPISGLLTLLHRPAKHFSVTTGGELPQAQNVLVLPEAQLLQVALGMLGSLQPQVSM